MSSYSERGRREGYDNGNREERGRDYDRNRDSYRGRDDRRGRGRDRDRRYGDRGEFA